MKSLQQEFDEVLLVYPGAQLQANADGSHLVMLPSVALPPGWSQPSTHVRFVVPVGYPYAAPDCFWADQSLRLATGMLPQNSANGNPSPGQPDPATLWFSWHLNATLWTPGASDLMTYVRVIKKRFEAVS
ncbi:MAG: E2/UBC family protein [Luteibacter sp.]|uniref:E2/UBC family protein n=1 Tax=Luteibacter sp. TaxID=1886636 RepID=UPI00280977B6|nr:E2/UBC family protein [Luteibacter sp.]MDQ7995274.1 E2/UBC family protein [Luteibacter sp.]